MENLSIYCMHFGGMIFLMLCFFIFSCILFRFFHPAIGGGAWTSRSMREDSLALLKNRLAKGEITVEEFESLKSHL